MYVLKDGGKQGYLQQKLAKGKDQTHLSPCSLQQDKSLYAVRCGRNFEERNKFPQDK